MSNNSNHYRLLLDLDALLDTRMGTLLLLNKAAASAAIENGYHTRLNDGFGKLTGGLITDEQFTEAYAKRDIDTLKKSIITGIPHVLVTYVETLKVRLLRNLEVDSISIDLNIYPYILPGPDVQMMIHAFGTIIPDYVKINVTRLSPDQLPPDVFKAAYNGWATYNFDEWFQAHHQTLLFKRANELTVILPRLHLREPEEYDKQPEGLRDADPHNLHAMVMEEFIRLEYLPVCDFCFFTPGTYASPPAGEDQTDGSSSSSSSSGSASGSSTKSA